MHGRYCAGETTRRLITSRTVLRWRLFVPNHCRDIDLKEHAWYSKATDYQKSIGRDRTVAVRFPSTLRNIRLVADVGDINYLLDCIRQRRPVRRERTLDFIVGVAALLISIAKMKNRGEASGCTFLVLGADPGKIDGLSRPVHRNDLSKKGLGPFGGIVALDLQILSRSDS